MNVGSCSDSEHFIPSSARINILRRRSDLYSNVTCEASNYNGSVMQKTITLDMNFLPTRISVTDKGAALLAGKSQTYSCSAYDSRPPALITWELDHKRIDGGKLSAFNQIFFSSSRKFVPFFNIKISKYSIFQEMISFSCKN